MSLYRYSASLLNRSSPIKLSDLSIEASGSHAIEFGVFGFPCSESWYWAASVGGLRLKV